MKELSLAVLAFLLQVMVFVSIGSTLLYKMKLKMELSMALLIGYISYFSVFGILMIPCTLLWVSLSAAAKIWAVCMCLAVGTAFFVLLRKKHSDIWDVPKKEWDALGVVVFLTVVLQCLIVVFYQDTTVDAAYYVGQVSTSVYTDTLQRYDPYTGAILKKFNVRYMFSSYPMHNAIWCRLLGIHPIVQAKMVMSVINVLTANAVVYQIGKRLFEGQKRKAQLMVCIAAFLQLFSYTIYTPGTFFFTRCYEGKAILANISMVLVFYCGIWFWQNTEDKRMWIFLLFTSISAITFSGSAIIMPAAVSAAILPGILKKRKFRKIVSYVLVMLPSVLYLAVYVGAKFGNLSFAAS